MNGSPRLLGILLMSGTYGYRDSDLDENAVISSKIVTIGRKMSPGRIKAYLIFE